MTVFDTICEKCGVDKSFHEMGSPWWVLYCLTNDVIYEYLIGDDITDE